MTWVALAVVATGLFVGGICMICADHAAIGVAVIATAVLGSAGAISVLDR